MTTCFCYGCGVKKDPEVEEMYKGKTLCTDEPIPSLIVLDCQPYNFDDPNWKSVIVCLSCFDRLSLDMWISRNCWESLNPFILFNDLPKMCSREIIDPVQIEERRQDELRSQKNEQE